MTHSGARPSPDTHGKNPISNLGTNWISNLETNPISNKRSRGLWRVGVLGKLRGGELPGATLGRHCLPDPGESLSPRHWGDTVSQTLGKHCLPSCINSSMKFKASTCLCVPYSRLSYIFHIRRLSDYCRIRERTWGDTVFQTLGDTVSRPLGRR